MTKTTASKYRYVGRHIDDLADGRTVEPGQTVALDEAAVADPHNARLIDEGLLVDTNPAKKEESA
jgi:hypothetical protein